MIKKLIINFDVLVFFIDAYAFQTMKTNINHYFAYVDNFKNLLEHLKKRLYSYIFLWK